MNKISKDSTLYNYQTKQMSLISSVAELNQSVEKRDYGVQPSDLIGLHEISSETSS